MTTREEHIQWVKERALAELDAGSTAHALTSIQQDLSKHPETNDHVCLELMVNLACIGDLSTDTQVRDFIEKIS